MGELRIRLRLEGLLHCWYVLPQRAACIQDVCNDIIRSFELHDDCPLGVSLYMDGFVLPPGQSILLLNDKDLISVQPRDSSARTGTLSGNSRAKHSHSENGELKSRKRKDRNDEADLRLSALTDDVHPKKLRNSVSEPESSDSAISPSPNPMTKHAALPPVYLPGSTRIQFPVLFAILTLMQLPCTDLQLLKDEYAAFKKGKISRETLVEKLKEVAGVCLLYKAMAFMQVGKEMSKLQPLSCSVEHAAGGKEVENSTIMPKR